MNTGCVRSVNTSYRCICLNSQAGLAITSGFKKEFDKEHIGKKFRVGKEDWMKDRRKALRKKGFKKERLRKILENKGS